MSYLPSGEVRCTTIRKVGDCFCVVTPWRRTSSGRRASAWADAVLHAHRRVVGIGAGLKVTVICSTPSEPATDLRYIMSSTPLIASSSGVATVSAITFGLAPGYTVRTTTDGGTTSGYSLIGSSGIAIRPAAKITIDSTAAKIGRSMKNLEKSMGDSLAARPATPGASAMRVRMGLADPPRAGEGTRGRSATRGEALLAGSTASVRAACDFAPAALATCTGGGAPIAIAFGATGMPGKNTFCTPCTITLSVRRQARLDHAQAIDHAAEHDVLAHAAVLFGPST